MGRKEGREEERGLVIGKEYWEGGMKKRWKKGEMKERTNERTKGNGENKEVRNGRRNEGKEIIKD